MGTVINKGVKRNSFVFPNHALVTATMHIGKAFDAAAIRVFGTVVAVLVVGVWLGVLFEMGRALVRGKLLWPVGDGGDGGDFGGGDDFGGDF